MGQLLDISLLDWVRVLRTQSGMRLLTAHNRRHCIVFALVECDFEGFEFLVDRARNGSFDVVVAINWGFLCDFAVLDLIVSSDCERYEEVVYLLDKPFVGINLPTVVGFRPFSVISISVCDTHLMDFSYSHLPIRFLMLRSLILSRAFSTTGVASDASDHSSKSSTGSGFFKPSYKRATNDCRPAKHSISHMA